MPLSLTEDFRTLEEFESQPGEIARQIERTGRPVVVTAEGKPRLVVLDAETYEKELQICNLRRLLAEAEDNVRQGKVRPAREFLKELNRGEKVRGSDGRRRRA